MTKIKSCPFCGSEKVKAQHGVGMVMILCYKCGATVSFYEKERKEQAIEAWNSLSAEEKQVRLAIKKFETDIKWRKKHYLQK